MLHLIAIGMQKLIEPTTVKVMSYFIRFRSLSQIIFIHGFCGLVYRTTRNNNTINWIVNPTKLYLTFDYFLRVSFASNKKRRFVAALIRIKKNELSHNNNVGFSRVYIQLIEIVYLLDLYIQRISDAKMFERELTVFLAEYETDCVFDGLNSWKCWIFPQARVSNNIIW